MSTKHNNWLPFVNAEHNLSQAAVGFCQAHTLIGAGHYGQSYADNAMLHLTRALDALGYDLVKRETPKVEEAA